MFLSSAGKRGGVPAGDTPAAALHGRPIRVFGLPILPIDAVILGGCLVFGLLTAVFHSRLEKPLLPLLRAFGGGLLYLGSLLWLRSARRPILRFLVRTVAVQGMFFQIYLVAQDIQGIFFAWNDAAVLRWEAAVFGVQPVVSIQRLYRPWLTEWMMFVYVAYIVIYPLLGAYIYFRRGEKANEDYLYNLGLANLLCCAGFLIFPVAGPLFRPEVRELLTTPLQGGIFTWMGEWIRANVHTPGATIPSPHCAVATVMWIMARRYSRRGFLALAPVILSLYVSTVYGRYHYVSDAVVGIALAVIVVALSPALAGPWRRAGRRPDPSP